MSEEMDDLLWKAGKLKHPYSGVPLGRDMVKLEDIGSQLAKNQLMALVNLPHGETTLKKKIETVPGGKKRQEWKKEMSRQLKGRLPNKPALCSLCGEKKHQGKLINCPNKSRVIEQEKQELTKLFKKVCQRGNKGKEVRGKRVNTGLTSRRIRETEIDASES